jgi:hypothetical protein
VHPPNELTFLPPEDSMQYMFHRAVPNSPEPLGTRDPPRPARAIQHNRRDTRHAPYPGDARRFRLVASSGYTTS